MSFVEGLMEVSRSDKRHRERLVEAEAEMNSGFWEGGKKVRVSSEESSVGTVVKSIGVSQGGGQPPRLEMVTSQGKSEGRLRDGSLVGKVPLQQNF